MRSLFRLCSVDHQHYFVVERVSKVKLTIHIGFPERNSFSRLNAHAGIRRVSEPSGHIAVARRLNTFDMISPSSKDGSAEKYQWRLPAGYAPTMAIV